MNDIKERFMTKVEPDGECWIWQAGTNPNRNGVLYGVFAINGRNGRAHRAAYQLFIGPLSKTDILDHLCKTPLCVRPDHLEIVTHRENILRGTAPAAFLAKRTACQFGHPFDLFNTLFRPSRRGRLCKTCYERRLAEKRVDSLAKSQQKGT